jgi:hypothetical protein
MWLRQPSWNLEFRDCTGLTYPLSPSAVYYSFSIPTAKPVVSFRICIAHLCYSSVPCIELAFTPSHISPCRPMLPSHTQNGETTKKNANITTVPYKALMSRIRLVIAWATIKEIHSHNTFSALTSVIAHQHYFEFCPAITGSVAFLWCIVILANPTHPIVSFLNIICPNTIHAWLVLLPYQIRGVFFVRSSEYQNREPVS